MTRTFGLVVLFVAAGMMAGATISAHAQDLAANVVADCEGCPDLVPMPDGSYMGRYLVTRDQFATYAAENEVDDADGCHQGHNDKWAVNPDARWTNPGFDQAGDHPVVCVSWLDATGYADWLSARTGKSYRLPTLEESSAAAAVDSPTTLYPWGENPDEVCVHGNVADLSFGSAQPEELPEIACDDGYAFTSPVDAFPPNSAGIHDGYGNVWQWTNSCLNGDCSNAIVRGGGWNVPWMQFYETGGNFGDRILLRNYVLGFRVMRDPD